MQGYQALTEKEKQTLRLVVRGHDAKSMAHHLGLSVHTVNERLRYARRKLEVSSSKAAARMLLEREERAPQTLVGEEIGDARAAPGVTQGTPSDALARTGKRFVWGIAGVAVMSIILGALALATFADGAEQVSSSAPTVTAQANTAAETVVSGAAREWLELGDAGRWEEGWRGTSTEFRRLNTVAAWEAASLEARVPLGAVRSRVLVSQDEVPAPPAGVQVVKFRSDFANRQGVTETVSLAREDGAWKVVGVYLDW